MSSTKFLAGVIVGAAAGVALAMFMNSDKGQELISDLKSAAGKAGDSLKNKFNDLKDQVSDTVQKGKQFAQDMSDEAQNYTA
jgi:gas vesicle protein